MRKILLLLFIVCVKFSNAQIKPCRIDTVKGGVYFFPYSSGDTLHLSPGTSGYFISACGGADSLIHETSVWQEGNIFPIISNPMHSLGFDNWSNYSPKKHGYFVDDKFNKIDINKVMFLLVEDRNSVSKKSF